MRNSFSTCCMCSNFRFGFEFSTVVPGNLPLATGKMPARVDFCGLGNEQKSERFYVRRRNNHNKNLGLLERYRCSHVVASKNRVGMLAGFYGTLGASRPNMSVH